MRSLISDPPPEQKTEKQQSTNNGRQAAGLLAHLRGALVSGHNGELYQAYSRDCWRRCSCHSCRCRNNAGGYVVRWQWSSAAAAAGDARHDRWN